MNRLFCFGLGYSARVLAKRLSAKGWSIAGTSRSPEGVSRIQALGFEGYQFDGSEVAEAIGEALSRATHVLISIAPPEGGDPVLRHFSHDFKTAEIPDWVGYLSTVGVYGNRDGDWVDETSLPKPVSERSKRRVVAENQWLRLCEEHNVPVHIFRIAGIYGPGRSPLDKLKAGRSRRIVKPGQVFNRIHVEDIASILEASIANPNPGAIYNVSDDEPAPPQIVIEYAAELIGMDPPPEVAFDEADMTPMARSFYGENKRVSNKRIRNELGVKLGFPTYREGLSRIAEGDEK